MCFHAIIPNMSKLQTLHKIIPKYLAVKAKLYIMTESVCSVSLNLGLLKCNISGMQKDGYTEQILLSWLEMDLSITVRFRNSIMKFII